MIRRPISHAEILEARDAGAGWSRALLERWGVPWPTPLFWRDKLVWGGTPYREPTVDEVRASPALRALIWTPPVEAPPAAAAPPPPPPPAAPAGPAKKRPAKGASKGAAPTLF